MDPENPLERKGGSEFHQWKDSWEDADLFDNDGDLAPLVDVFRPDEEKEEEEGQKQEKEKVKPAKKRTKTVTERPKTGDLFQNYVQ